MTLKTQYIVTGPCQNTLNVTEGMNMKSLLAMNVREIVSDTTRWVGHAYHAILYRSPGTPLPDLMIEIISARYSLPSVRDVRDMVITMIVQDKIRGLAHLVTTILGIEAGYHENTMENRFMFTGIILEELRLLSIQNNIIDDLSSTIHSMRDSLPLRTLLHA